MIATKPLRRQANCYFLVAVGILIATVSFSWFGPIRPVPVLFAGIQVNEPDLNRWVNALANAGLDAVQVTLYARQGRWNTGDLSYEPSAPAVIDEIRMARRRGLRSVLVMRVALEHAIIENRHLWHGMIWPREDELERWFDAYRGFVLWGAGIAARESVDLFAIGNELNSVTSTTPVDELPALYSYYLSEQSRREVRRRLLTCEEILKSDSGATGDLNWVDGGRYLDLDTMLRAEEAAHRTWVTEVVGGTDDVRVRLDQVNRRRERYSIFWRRLIEEVRQVYQGPVTYGANFDQFEEVAFWDGLDALGVNAYFPLTLYGVESGERRSYMRKAWGTVADRLQQAASVGNNILPVVFIEIGWTRKVGGTIRPYSYQRFELLETVGTSERASGLTCVHWASQPDDPGERVDALAALGDVVAAGEFPALRGLTLWKLSTDVAHRAIEPFVVVLPNASPTPNQVGKPTADETLDLAFLDQAVAISRRVNAFDAKWQNGPKPANVSLPHR